MTKIFGVSPHEVEAVTEDSAPSGRKDFLVWNPSYIDSNVPCLGRHSSLSEATRLMRFLMKQGIRVILFCKDRRRIEKDAFSGRLLGIIATNALELGVDIGSMDAVIMLGFPMSIASFRQQAGRAGRRSRDSLAVLVADQIPIDQHFVEHPEELFEKSGDELIIDIDNRPILQAHLQCAAHEMPLSLEDEKYFGTLFQEVCETHLMKDTDGWYHTHPNFLPFPSKYICIRGIQEEMYVVINVTKGAQSILEEVEISRAMFEVYEGGVVKEVSHDLKLAKVIQADVNWITSPRDFTNVDAVQTYRIKQIRNSPERIYYGRVEVIVKVFGFFKIRNKVILDQVDMETSSWERDTTGLWMDIPKSLLGLFRRKGINPAEAIHAAEHAFLKQFSMAQDLRTECKAPEKEYKQAESKRNRPARLIFYDAIGKGGGVAAKAFDDANSLLQNARKAIETCDCKEGCANCVQSSSCKESNLVCSKLGALLVVSCLLGLKIDSDAIPMDNASTQETIVEAQTIRAIDGIEVETTS
ncbi:hypothetical protein H0H81_009225 [Sphagnurus paluster]|uniref:Helicase C-terminal domain-containing protein n=1 Tax=Sphagnurus paluster TaxID=117069 RepID=A0A9P7GQQ5_9AGAR|nr:hypothetical protein H0H81_009225 [Sphagnurus paluster]